MMRKIFSLILLAIISTSAHSDVDELAKQLTNPVANLISMPVQFNYDSGFGSEDGDRLTINVQPVIPIEINNDWNIISRTILPLIEQHNIIGNSGSQSGTGDIVQSLFLSPNAPTSSGWIWGAGPVLLIPSASNKLLGTEKWAAGPTAVFVKMDNQWTYGLLANHLWDYAGENDRADINASLVQPFVSFRNRGWTYTLQTESSYDWDNQEWGVPINGYLSKIVRIGKLPVSFAVGARYWAEAPENGAEGWGGRFSMTAMLPK
jgi:hypothetical protein